MAEEFDAARIGIQLDRAEQCGAIETDVAATLRGLVRVQARWIAEGRPTIRVSMHPSGWGFTLLEPIGHIPAGVAVSITDS